MSQYFNVSEKKQIQRLDVWQDDSGGAEMIASNLKQLLINSGTPFVLNLNAPWGMGKSFLLQRWKEQLLRENYPCVYINAWETDYFNAPLVALMGEIEEQLLHFFGEARGGFRDEVERLLSKAGKVITRLLRNTITEIARQKVGTPAVEAFEALGDDLSGNLREEYKKVKQSVNAFKDLLYRLIACIKTPVSEAQSFNLPFFILIDELDRCKPSYAISLIEKVKHLFNVEGIVFVIATDNGQLGAALRGIYGEALDTDEYLRKIFHHTFDLKLDRKRKYKNFLQTHFKNEDYEKITEEREFFITGVVELSLMANFTFRQYETVIHRLIAVIRIYGRKKNTVTALLLFLLSVYKMKAVNIYDKQLIDEMPPLQVKSRDVLYKPFTFTFNSHPVFEGMIGCFVYSEKISRLANRDKYQAGYWKKLKEAFNKSEYNSSYYEKYREELNRNLLLYAGMLEMNRSFSG